MLLRIFNGLFLIFFLISIAGWDGLKRWVQTGVNCNKNGWRFVKFKSGVLATDPKVRTVSK